MEHDRAPLAAVGPHVADPEPVRHGAVDLNRREGPGALEGVAEVERDLGAVEGPVPGRERVLEARPGETLLQHALGLVPESRLAEELLRPGLDRDRDVGEAEVVIDLAGHPQEEPELLVGLLRRAEYVRIVLREAAHAGKPGEHAGALEAVQAREVGVANRQVAVRLLALAEEVHVARAVHRLHAVFFLVGAQKEHVVAVAVVVTRGLEDLGLVDERGDDLGVAVAPVELANVGDQFVVDDRAARVEERDARRDRV